MRSAVLGVVAALALGACDDVVERIDALRETGRRFAHEGLRPCDEEGSVVRSIASSLREFPDGRALLDEGGRAVPGLRKLLGDPARRGIAVVFLAEIGGTDAAEGLLRCWRDLRDDAREARVYRVIAADGRLPLGYVYEGVDRDFYGELLLALGHAGRPVSHAIASDTEAAMAESERLAETRKDLVFREQRDVDGRRVELRWRAAPVETACEGLRMLAMSSAPEAPSLFVKALRSPVRALRRTAVQEVLYLGEDAQKALPELGRLLDDPDLRGEVVEQVAFLLDDGTVPDQNVSEEQRAVLAVGYKARLQELGHLPR